jgi:hypothetical protein
MFNRRAGGLFLQGLGVGRILAIVALILAILDLAHIALGSIPEIPLAVILLALAILL